MSILVIGGDRLGNIDKNLKRMGFDQILHVSGRKKRHTQMSISDSTDLVLVLTDFVNHNLSKSIKEQTKGIGVKTLFSKRSWANIASVMTNFKIKI